MHARPQVYRFRTRTGAREHAVRGMAQPQAARERMRVVTASARMHAPRLRHERSDLIASRDSSQIQIITILSFLIYR